MGPEGSVPRQYTISKSRVNTPLVNHMYSQPSLKKGVVVRSEKLRMLAFRIYQAAAVHEIIAADTVVK